MITRLQVLAAALLGASLGAAGGCGGDDDAAADARAATVDAATAADAPLPDAAAPLDAPAPDAFNPCPGKTPFTGTVRDWVTATAIFQVTAGVVGDPASTTTSAPNGRVLLCLPVGFNADVLFTHDDYLPLVQAVHAHGERLGTVLSPLITPADADALFAGDLAPLLRSAEAAQVLVDVRGYPGGEPLVGAAVALGNGHDGAFTRDAAGAFSAGATLTDDAVVWFANADVGEGSTTVQVTAPDGWSCTGRTSVPLEAGRLTFAAWACEQP